MVVPACVARVQCGNRHRATPSPGCADSQGGHVPVVISRQRQRHMHKPQLEPQFDGACGRSAHLVVLHGVLHGLLLLALLTHMTHKG
eukprot:scaffold9668_cov35-Tisochrysis_lutea.AAC.3